MGKIEMYSEKDRKMLWTIPFVLAILCGVINPYGGLVGVISLVFGFLLVYFLQKNICSETKKLRSKDVDKEVYMGLLVSNWVMTAFAFLMMNIVMNILIAYLCNLSMKTTGTAPVLSCSFADFFVGNWNVCYLLFIGNALFHIIGTIMVFVEGNRMKKVYANSLKQEQLVEKETEKVTETKSETNEEEVEEKCEIPEENTNIELESVEEEPEK